MKTVIGIDVGSSTTKIIGLKEGLIQSPMFITAKDPISSLFGALGKFMYDNHLQLSDIGRVMITGAGSAYVEPPLYGLPTDKTDEFKADGLGACYGSELQRMIVVSMGTGTSLVQIEGKDIRHIGGIGLGGGTLQGLSRLLLKTDHFKEIAELAKGGDISQINLQIRDISTHPLQGLPLDATASLFAKAQTNAAPADIAIGIIGMVLQAIGSAAILSSLNTGIKDFMLIGNMTKLPQCKVFFPKLEAIYGVRFHIPPYAEYRTAIGAALLAEEKAKH